MATSTTFARDHSLTKAAEDALRKLKHQLKAESCGAGNLELELRLGAIDPKTSKFNAGIPAERFNAISKAFNVLSDGPGAQYTRTAETSTVYIDPTGLRLIVDGDGAGAFEFKRRYLVVWGKLAVADYGSRVSKAIMDAINGFKISLSCEEGVGETKPDADEFKARATTTIRQRDRAIYTVVDNPTIKYEFTIVTDAAGKKTYEIEIEYAPTPETILQGIDPILQSFYTVFDM